LSGEVVPEEKFFLLSFVDGFDLQIEVSTWFTILNPTQIDLLEEFLKEKSYF
jgi:hypothetical protein